MAKNTEGKTAPNQFALDENSYLETTATKEEVQNAINYVKTYEDYCDEMLVQVLKAVGNYARVIYVSSLEKLDW
jgi:hypothetical protein